MAMGKAGGGSPGNRHGSACVELAVTVPARLRCPLGGVLPPCPSFLKEPPMARLNSPFVIRQECCQENLKGSNRSLALPDRIAPGCVRGLWDGRNSRSDVCDFGRILEQIGQEIGLFEVLAEGQNAVLLHEEGIDARVVFDALGHAIM